MNILIVKTVPGEINVKKITYNHQEIGLARAFRKAGHVCDVMCCADREPSEQKIPTDGNGEITLYCMKAVKILKNGFYLDADAIFERYDILHASEYNQMFTWRLAKKYPDKTVCYHGPYYAAFNRRYNLMAKVFDPLFLKRYKKLDTPFLTKSGLAERYLRGKGLRNVRTVGVGIDIQALRSASGDKLKFVDEIRAFPGEKILYIGRLEPRRNVFFLLDLLEALRKRREVSLILVGAGEAAYVSAFFRKADEMGLRERILYQESLEQRHMERLYACADVFVLPTLYDIYGMVLLEAMYFGLCVFTTVNGGSDMMIDDGQNGYVFRNFDASAWSAAIWKVMEDGELRRRVGAKAKRTIEDGFSWEKLVPKFLNAYEETLKRKERGPWAEERKN